MSLKLLAILYSLHSPTTYIWFLQLTCKLGILTQIPSTVNTFCISSSLHVAPTEPLSPDAKQVNSTAILLSWEPPSLAGQNGPNISYTVEYGWSGQIQAVLHTTSTSILIGGLSPYIPYEFKIAAVSADNETGTFTDLFSGNITRSEF